MGRHRTENLADPALRTDCANKAATLDTHIRTIEAAADELTPEQANRLRALLPAPADPDGRTNDLHAVAGMMVALAVIGLTGFIVVCLSGNPPAVIAAVLTAFAAVLAPVPAIIKALRGH